ncbi:MAG: LPS assembly protein LptD [Alphaproteobacteria bacterium]|nr:LPS assembly protein LptD [Alphaproteobacteria bacterium]
MATHITKIFKPSTWIWLVLVMAISGIIAPSWGQDAKWPLAPPNTPRKLSNDNSNTPFLLKADEVRLSDHGDFLTADGAVEITQEDRVLRADHIEYDKRANMIRAIGHISLTLETGDVVFGDLALSDEKLNNGLIENFRMLMVDNSRIVGTDGAFSKNIGKEINQAIYSPCNICASDPTRPPIWQIKSSRVTHDEQNHIIIYRNAQLQIFGVSVFYSPYFSSPDPTVKRQSGILTPKFAIGNNTGFYAQIPYFWAIDKSRDITFEPLYYSSRGEGMAAEYRQRFDQGYFRLAGSGIGATPTPNGKSSDRKFYGNFAGNGGIAVSEHWRAGFIAEHVSDRNYLTDFMIGRQFTNQDFTPASNYYKDVAFTEGFYGPDYHRIMVMGFQSKSTTTGSANLSVIHPVIQNNFYIKPDNFAGAGNINQNILFLSHPDNSKVERLSEQIQYNVHFTSNDGQIFTWQTQIRGDIYQIYLPNNNQQGLMPFNNNLSRIIPKSAFRWDFPLINQFGATSVLVQPTTQIILTPRGLNNSQIPNNDSQSFDLNQSNLFSLQRFAGLDRIASGSRIDYAVKATALRQDQVTLSGFIGQSWRADNDLIYPVGSGADRQLSDVLLGSEYWPTNYLILSYQSRLDNQNFRPSFQQESIGLIRPLGSINISYIENTSRLHSDNVAIKSAQQGFISPLSRSLTANGMINIDRYWKIASNVNRDLVLRQWSYLNSSLIYRDECFGIALNYYITGNKANPNRPSQTIAFRFSFKYLGESSFALPSF